MEAVYPAAASALARGRRAARRSAARSPRHRTQPVTFAEIKEVDEENEELVGCECAARAERERRRPDFLDEQLGERLGRQFAEFRRRRPRRNTLPEPSDELDAAEEPPAPAAQPAADAARAHGRAGSEPLEPR